MKTSFTILLTPQQLKALQRGERITIEIGVSKEGVHHPVETERQASAEVRTNLPSFLEFFQQRIDRLEANGNVRTKETYKAAYNKFQTFRQGEDIPAVEIDGAMMEAFQAFLRAQRLSMNSISFYMRIVRAVYHRAVKEGMCQDCHPFTHVFTGSQTTVKRALSLEELKRISRLRLENKEEIFARDLFLLSFYTRGMSFVDLAYLRKEDVHDGTMVYIRRKTGQRLAMRWEEEMERIVCRYPTHTPYLLPIIQHVGQSERNQYRLMQDRVNRSLKTIAVKAGIKQNLTMYCARHSWATIARENKIPVSVISHAMGHTSETTTEVYLKAIDSAVIDRCNHDIIRLVKAPHQLPRGGEKINGNVNGNDRVKNYPNSSE